MIASKYGAAFGRPFLLRRLLWKSPRGPYGHGGGFNGTQIKLISPRWPSTCGGPPFQRQLLALGAQPPHQWAPLEGRGDEPGQQTDAFNDVH